MGRYSGSWAKGFASTFDPVGAINLGLQWKEKKEAKKKIDDAVEQLKKNSTELAAKYDKAIADGSITQQEYADAITWAIPLGDEIMGRLERLYNNYRQYTKEQLNYELAEIDSFWNLSADLDFSNIEEIKTFGNNLTQDKAKTKWSLFTRSIENRKTSPVAEVFLTAEGAKAKYPDAAIKYNSSAGGYVIDIPTPEAPPTKLDRMGETKKWLDAAYETGNATYFNRIAKERGSPATFETYKQAYEKPGAGAKAIPAPLSLENIREEIADAPTVEDARRINKNGIEQYGEEPFKKGTGIDDVDRFWGESQIPYLNNAKMAIGNITDEKGWLIKGREGKEGKKGIVTKDEVGVDFAGEQLVEDIYEMLREEYMRIRDALEKLGIDISQFPKLKPLEEIEKVEFWEGAVGAGVKGIGIGIQRGQYKSIYY